MSQFTKANKLINWCIINWSSEASILWGPDRGAVICVFTNSREHSAVLLKYTLIQAGSKMKSQRPFNPQKEYSALAGLFSSWKPYIIHSPAWSVVTSGRHPSLPRGVTWVTYLSDTAPEAARSGAKTPADSSPGSGSFTDFLLCPHPVERMSALSS